MDVLEWNSSVIMAIPSARDGWSWQAGDLYIAINAQKKSAGDNVGFIRSFFFLLLSSFLI